MPAFGLGFLVFLVVQAFISSFVYSEAKESGSRSPLVAGVSVFLLGVGLAFVFSTVVGVVVVEFVGIFIYRIGVHAANGRSAST
ncbi:hypothetical protein [Haloarcula montana]|uniref:hypothetical protein n=1 Tax=Haloarcula montana TaxID=3111776 RepID=UPI002D77C7A7|nr:hypothetical protein [Haloarcula sp. GH36]